MGFVGVCCIEFENCALYLSKEDYKYHNTKNAVWLVFGNAVHYQKWNGKYVAVDGKFNKDNTGHFNAYSGAVEHVTYFDLLSSEEDQNNGVYKQWSKFWWLLLLVPIMAIWWYRVRCHRNMNVNSIK